MGTSKSSEVMVVNKTGVIMGSDSSESQILLSKILIIDFVTFASSILTKTHSLGILAGGQVARMISIVDNIFSRFSQSLGIDLGTANTLVGVGNKGIVLREPTIVCRHKKSKAIIAIGTSAKKMLGRVPGTIEVLRPLKDGVVADFELTRALLSYFVGKIQANFAHFSVLGPKVIIGVPTKISKVERRAVVEAALNCGARVAYLLDEPMAAAIGVNLPVTEPVGSMIVNIGGGTSEIAIISLGGIVSGRSLSVAGNRMDEDITAYIRSRWGLVIGEATAEAIKINLGSAYPADAEREMIVRGRDLEKGIPATIKVTSAAIREALSPACAEILAAIRQTIEDAPPELVADIAQRGVVLCGGGAQLAGLAKLISSEVKMPVIVAADPTSCVALGAMKVVSDRALLSKVKVAQA